MEASRHVARQLLYLSSAKVFGCGRLAFKLAACGDRRCA